MTIQWRDQMAVGDAMIDADHRKLIDLINSVEQLLLAAGKSDELTACLNELATYTVEHFDREENLMRSKRYNGLIHHRQAHRELVVQLGSIRLAIEGANAEAVPAQEIDRLVELLRSWLLDHVLREDMLLKPFLKVS